MAPTRNSKPSLKSKNLYFPLVKVASNFTSVILFNAFSLTFLSHICILALYFDIIKQTYISWLCIHFLSAFLSTSKQHNEEKLRSHIKNIYLHSLCITFYRNQYYHNMSSWIVSFKWITLVSLNHSTSYAPFISHTALFSAQFLLQINGISTISEGTEVIGGNVAEIGEVLSGLS